MRILYLVSSQGIRLNMKGGAGTHMRGTIHGFKQNGHTVLPLVLGDELVNKVKDQLVEKVMSTSENTKKWKDFLPKFIRILYRDINLFVQSYRFSRRSISKIIEFNPDIIYERSCMLSVTGNLISIKTKIPLYIETSGCLVEIFHNDFGTTSTRFANWLEKQKYKKANVVVTEAKSAIKYVQNKYELEEKEIVAKPLGIEVPNDLSHSKRKLRENNRLNVGYIGTFASYHNVELLLPVFKKFKNEKIHFYLIGSGGNRSHIQSWIINNQIENVTFTGYISKQKLNDILNILDIGIVPNCETHMSPIKTFEYGVHNICPMVPDYEAFSGLIKSDENGILFDPNSSESIIKNIEKAISNQIDYVNCAVNWNKFVIDNFQWHQVVRDILNNAEIK